MGESSDDRPVLLVLSSTYPRWAGDPEPGFVHELCKRLVPDFRVVVVAPHAPGARVRETLDGVELRRFRYAPGSLETLVNDGGIVTNLRRSPWKWLLLPGFMLSLLWTAWRTIAAERPAVAHAHWLVPQGLALAMLGLIDRRTPPFVVTSHGADLYALRSFPMQVLKRWVARRAVASTVVSGAMREEMARIGVDVSKVSVQPMGVDLSTRFTPDLAVERSRDEVLFVGRLVEKKGVHHLLDALPLILRQHASAFLTIAGFGPWEGALRARAARLGVQGRVDFVGAMEQSRLPVLYRRAGVFVAPFVKAGDGDREGLGLVTVEAMGCGCPAIVGDVEAVQELVSNGALVQVVDARDPAALASQVVALLRNRPAPEALAASVNRFDWQRCADGYRQLLQERVGTPG